MPLSTLSPVTIAVIGDSTTVAGSGSGYVNPSYIVTPSAGIRRRLTVPPPQVCFYVKCNVIKLPVQLICGNPEVDYNYNGNDLNSGTLVQSSQECCDLCIANRDAGCRFW